MSKKQVAVPKYRLHRASRQAVVTLAGRDHYLGPWRSLASRTEYDRLIGEWLAAGRPTSRLPPVDEITITELIARYFQYAKGYYLKDGGMSQPLDGLKAALKSVRALYGDTSAARFGPLALRAVQHKLVAEGYSRRYVNDHVSRIKRMFKWAAAEEILPASVFHALATVSGLRKGRTTAREAEPVLPVDDKIIEATLPHLTPVVAAMVQFQRLTGARPAEVCQLRPQDIDRSGDVWLYTPERHKTEHHGRPRSICIGPRAQKVLAPFLDRSPEAYCFSPQESEATRNTERRRQRRSPMTPSQAKRGRRGRRRPPSDRYDSHSYCRAIARACRRAFPLPVELSAEKAVSGPKAVGAPQAARAAKGVAKVGDASHNGVQAAAEETRRSAARKWRREHYWSPNRLRHSAATEIRRKFGLEAAQVSLGHASANVTQVYAERDLAKAVEVAKEIG